MVLMELAKNLVQLHHTITTGEIADILTDADLDAAREAFQKVRLAKNSTAQIWSAINHLESAHSKLHAIYNGKFAFRTSKQEYLNRMEEKDRYVLCLLACCYRILEEKQLCDQALEKAEMISRRFINRRMTPLALIDPLMWQEMFICFFEPNDCLYTTEQVKEVAAAIKSSW